MTRLLLSTALAGLLAASAANAQDDHHHDSHGGGGAPQPHAAPAMSARPPSGPNQAPAGAPGMRHDDHGRQGPSASGAMTGPRPGPAMAGPRPSGAMGGPRPGPTMGASRPGPAMAGPRSNSRPSFNTYHRAFNAPQRFHAPAYRRPSGWYAQRWTYGQILPSLFWTRDDWIGDFNDYGLMPPPPGTVWVRDGYDALLIDQDSGEIIQVAYSVFY